MKIFKSCFKDCVNGQSQLKVILHSDCLKYKKIVLNLGVDDDKKLDELFDELKNVIKKYERT